jgi:cobalamin biosynthesis Mg chelatase CobN
MRRILTVIAVVSMLALATPATAWAQTNSPAGNQPSQSPPDTSAGGTSNQSGAGSNAGSDDATGNRTTPGGAGATGGGAATEKEPESEGGAGTPLVAFLVVLAAVGLVAAIAITRRSRGADRRLESAGRA